MGRERDTEGVVLKTCTKCKEEKPLDAYYKCKKSKDGKRQKCKSCTSAANKAWKEKNKEKAADKDKEWYKKNKDKVSERSKLLYEEDRERILNRQKEYNARNKEKKAAYDKGRYEINKEKRIKQCVDYRRERYAEDPYFRMKSALRGAVSRWKLGSTQELIGISFEEFASLYGTGEGMHLDHKIPMSWFDLTNDGHCKICQHHTNLQWITPEENLHKSNRYADINGEQVLRENFDLEKFIKNKR